MIGFLALTFVSFLFLSDAPFGSSLCFFCLFRDGRKMERAGKGWDVISVSLLRLFVIFDLLRVASLPSSVSVVLLRQPYSYLSLPLPLSCQTLICPGCMTRLYRLSSSFFSAFLIHNISLSLFLFFSYSMLAGLLFGMQVASIVGVPRPAFSSELPNENARICEVVDDRYNSVAFKVLFKIPVFI